VWRAGPEPEPRACYALYISSGYTHLVLKPQPPAQALLSMGLPVHGLARDRRRLVISNSSRSPPDTRTRPRVMPNIPPAPPPFPLFPICYLALVSTSGSACHAMQHHLQLVITAVARGFATAFSMHEGVVPFTERVAVGRPWLCLQLSCVARTESGVVYGYCKTSGQRSAKWSGSKSWVCQDYALTCTQLTSGTSA
jgi:hypothetical protein